ncbi:MAG: CBS domain-containing protein [Chloroflexi bacterium]|nr:CBS domain-containing protein [Chloroflexota bacterium]
MQQTPVKDWMKDLVIFIDPEATVNEGLSLMRHRYMASVIVNKTESNPEYGIVTSMDICDKIVAQGFDPSKTRIREIMVSPVFTVPATTTMKECAAKMKQLRVHHLPVADDHGMIIGMISSTDFLVVAEAMGTDFKERSLK